MKMIINSEIREVVYDEYYEDALSDSLASESGVNLTQIKKRNLNYFSSDVQSKTE
jgi:deoxycytidylate deaminase